jgi:peroxiredoxin
MCSYRRPDGAFQVAAWQVERSTFLIDENGRLREEWRKVKVKGHGAAVLDAVKKC